MSSLILSSPVYIHGPAAALPKRIVSNEDFVRWAGETTGIQTRAKFIETQAGIKERRWVEDHEAVSDLAVAAARALFVESPELPAHIKQIILSTISGDYISPPTAPFIQHQLGLRDVGAFDVGAACAGFVTGLHIGASFAMSSHQSQLIIAADIRSKFLNPKDFRVSLLFGDGAAACVVNEIRSGASFQLLGSRLLTDGSVADSVSVPAGGSRLPQIKNTDMNKNFIQMLEAPALFLKAVDGMSEGARALLEEMKISTTEIDWLVPHQGNIHLIRQVAKALGIDSEKTVETISKYGNTSGSTVGIALAELRGSGKLKSGQTILLSSAGGGGLAASAVIRAI